MVVILPNAMLTVEVRGHPWRRDARGVPVPTDDDALTTRGPFPGGVKELPDGLWSLRLDPQLGPVEGGDKISDGTGRVWVAAPGPKLHENVASHAIDYIAVTGTLDPPEIP